MCKFTIAIGLLKKFHYYYYGYHINFQATNSRPSLDENEQNLYCCEIILEGIALFGMMGYFLIYNKKIS